MDGQVVLVFFWWLALGALVAGIGITLGRELGLTVLLRYLGRTEGQRHNLLVRIGDSPWRSWAVLAAAAVIVAWWPIFHVTLFSGLWIVLLFIVVAMLVRPLQHRYRERMTVQHQRFWDALWALVALATLLVLGIGAGVIVSGAPFRFNSDLGVQWGAFASRFTPYEVLVPGLLSIVAGLWLAAARVRTRSEGVVAARARSLLVPLGILALALFVVGGIWSTQLTGYAVAGMPSLGASPLNGSTFAVPGAYLERFFAALPLVLVPLLAGLALLGALFYSWRDRPMLIGPLVVTGVVGMVATAGVMTYPVIVPSSTVPSQSLTTWNAALGYPVLIGLLFFLALVAVAAVVYGIRGHQRVGGKSATESAPD